MITKEEIEVLKEWIKGNYSNLIIDEDILYLLTKLVVEKENELDASTKDIVIPASPVSPLIPSYPWWDPYRVVYANGTGTPVKTDGGSGIEIPGEELKYTTTSTLNNN